MMYVSRGLRHKMGTKRTSADVVFEFLSRSTSVYDRTTKADTYLALGVRELWLLDPFNVIIEVRHAITDDDTLKWEMWRYPRGSGAKSRVLEGWEVSVDEILRGLEFTR
jgi:Uma2 family endonuclease